MCNFSVFSPDWESAQFSATGRPVMVFVHGGGFLIHSAGNYGDWNMCQFVPKIYFKNLKFLKFSQLRNVVNLKLGYYLILQKLHQFCSSF